jgi:hypothetical protein
MTEEEVREKIGECFACGMSGEPIVMKTDFRKLEALYVCGSKDVDFLCARNPLESGVCPLRNESGKCLWSEG